MAVSVRCKQIRPCTLVVASLLLGSHMKRSIHLVSLFAKFCPSRANIIATSPCGSSSSFLLRPLSYFLPLINTLSVFHERRAASSVRPTDPITYKRLSLNSTVWRQRSTMLPKSFKKRWRRFREDLRTRAGEIPVYHLVLHLVMMIRLQPPAKLCSTSRGSRGDIFSCSRQRGTSGSVPSGGRSQQ